jgi:hypothetical protein
MYGSTSWIKGESGTKGYTQREMISWLKQKFYFTDDSKLYYSNKETIKEIIFLDSSLFLTYDVFTSMALLIL